MIAFRYMQIMRQVKLESDYIAQLRGVMEKLVRRGSQMEDHGRIDLDFTLRIAFDLRLTEAEAALKQSAELVRRSDYRSDYYASSKP